MAGRFKVTNSLNRRWVDPGLWLDKATSFEGVLLCRCSLGLLFALCDGGRCTYRLDSKYVRAGEISAQEVSTIVKFPGECYMCWLDEAIFVYEQKILDVGAWKACYAVLLCTGMLCCRSGLVLGKRNALCSHIWSTNRLWVPQFGYRYTQSTPKFLT